MASPSQWLSQHNVHTTDKGRRWANGPKIYNPSPTGPGIQLPARDYDKSEVTFLSELSGLGPCGGLWRTQFPSKPGLSAPPLAPHCPQSQASSCARGATSAHQANTCTVTSLDQGHWGTWVCTKYLQSCATQSNSIYAEFPRTTETVESVWTV